MGNEGSSETSRGVYYKGLSLKQIEKLFQGIICSTIRIMILTFWTWT